MLDGDDEGDAEPVRDIEGDAVTLRDSVGVFATVLETDFEGVRDEGGVGPLAFVPLSVSVAVVDGDGDIDQEDEHEAEDVLEPVAVALTVGDIERDAVTLRDNVGVCVTLVVADLEGVLDGGGVGPLAFVPLSVSVAVADAI